MKALVYYCRWNGAALRLRGRDATAVWGQLVFTEENGERSQEFHFDLQSASLTLQTGGEPQTLKLDDMGVVVNSLE